MPSANSSGVACAFRDGQRAKGNNTVCQNGEVRLHGNRIAWHDDIGVPWVCFCGWATNTTQDRIRAILGAFNSTDMEFRVTRRGELFLNGEQVDPYQDFRLCGPLGRLAMQAERRLTENAVAT